MAIVKSLAIGKSVKSAGNLTYKTVRGRTIASQRITSNSSNTIKQSIQRTHFKLSAQTASLLQLYINNCYEKSKYGSSRNSFMSINKLFDGFGVVSEVKEGAIPLADIFIPAFDPGSSGSPLIKYSTYGSSSLIVQENIVFRDFTDSTDTTTSYKQIEEVTYTFPTPVAPEKAEIVCCWIDGNVESKLKGAFFELKILDLTDESITQLSDLGFIPKTVKDDNGNIISFNLRSGISISGINEIYGVVFPRLNGKIPKLSGLLYSRYGDV